MNVEDGDGSSVEELSDDEETQITQTNEVIKQSNGESLKHSNKRGDQTIKHQTAKPSNIQIP